MPTNLLDVVRDNPVIHLLKGLLTVSQRDRLTAYEALKLPVFLPSKQITIGLIPVQEHNEDQDEQQEENIKKPLSAQNSWNYDEQLMNERGSVHSLEKRLKLNPNTKDESESIGSLMIDSTLSPPSKHNGQTLEKYGVVIKPFLKRLGSSNVESTQTSPIEAAKHNSGSKMARMDSHEGFGKRDSLNRKTTQDQKSLSPDSDYHRFDSPMRSPVLQHQAKKTLKPPLK